MGPYGVLVPFVVWCTLINNNNNNNNNNILTSDRSRGRVVSDTTSRLQVAGSNPPKDGFFP